MRVVVFGHDPRSRSSLMRVTSSGVQVVVHPSFSRTSEWLSRSAWSRFSKDKGAHMKLRGLNSATGAIHGTSSYHSSCGCPIRDWNPAVNQRVSLFPSMVAGKSIQSLPPH
ncbi:hypothetical protein CBOM_08012 [Ceraceosorus bombacis]|uniref:Uncharacterized protein n=1 Tax=Ceraceosorus bombacis TaxID=401625 RepID=A0A0P1BKP1_9BASI|nr:hypothetical protein CBOM_08012 [Ceraceosorus bombacis]